MFLAVRASEKSSSNRNTCLRDTLIYVETQNVTLSVPKALLKRAKLVAVEQEKSLSRLLVEALEEKVKQKSDYAAARDRALEQLERGIFKSFKPVPRDELYDR
jgi:predicted transcriptional regulator